MLARPSRGCCWRVTVAFRPAGAGLPETPRPRQITVADGLPSNRINGLTEDRRATCGSPPATAWRASTASASASGAASRACATASSGRCTSTRATACGSATAQAGLAVLTSSASDFRYYNRANTPQMGDDNSLGGDLHARRRDLVRHRHSAACIGWRPDGRLTRFMPKRRRRAQPARRRSLAVAGRARRHAVGRHQGRRRALDGHGLRARAGRRALTAPLTDALCAWRRTARCGSRTPRGVSLRTPDGSVRRRRPGARRGDETVLQRAAARSRRHVLARRPARPGSRSAIGRIIVVPLYSGTAQRLVKPVLGRRLRRSRRRPVVRQQPPTACGTCRRTGASSRCCRAAPTTTRRSPTPHVRGIAPRPTARCGWWAAAASLDRLDPDSGRRRTPRSRRRRGLRACSPCSRTARGKVWVGYQARPGALRSRPPAACSLEQPRCGRCRAGERDQAFARNQRRPAVDGLRQRQRAGARPRRPREATLLPGDGRGIAAGAAVDQLGVAPDGGVWLAGSQGLSMLERRRAPFRAGPGRADDRVSTASRSARTTALWLARLGQPRALSLGRRHHWRGSSPWTAATACRCSRRAA